VTLTELRYVVAVARERHFGRAAESCFVSQPTLSVAIRKLEEELGVQLFERGTGEVAPTSPGLLVVEQAQRVLEEAGRIKELAESAQDPLAGTLRLGAIYTIGPYLLPKLIPFIRKAAPRLQLMIQENYTHSLAEALKSGDVDVILVAHPFAESGIVTRAVYDEPFLVAVPRGHPWEKKKRVSVGELAEESLLLLGSGHCFRDQVMELCSTVARSPRQRGMQRMLEGGSLETIRHMVATGVGITVLPSTSTVPATASDLIRLLPFARPAPERRVLLAWRKTFPRPEAIETLRQAILACDLPLATRLPHSVASG